MLLNGLLERMHFNVSRETLKCLASKLPVLFELILSYRAAVKTWIVAHQECLDSSRGLMVGNFGACLPNVPELGGCACLGPAKWYWDYEYPLRRTPAFLKV